MAIDLDGCPDYSSWTLDQLLVEARRLPLEYEPLFTWNELRDIIFRRDLGVLCRHPRVEQIYVNHFNPLLRAQHGTVEAYLKKKLGWTGHYTAPYWTRDQPCQVRLNDWAYSVPRGARHYVVWTSAPIFHPNLCSSKHAQVEIGGEGLSSEEKETWDIVRERGLGGATGTETTPDGCMAYAVDGLEGPGREISAFVLDRWPQKEVLWFANPPSLQISRSPIPKDDIRGAASLFHVSLYPLFATMTQPETQTSAGSRVAHTPAIIERIVAWIPYVDIHAVSTLLGLQQVSRAFLQAARVDPVWNPLLRRDFCNHQGPVIPTKLPINSPSLQDAVDEIISEQVSTVWQVYRQRKRLNHIAHVLLENLVHSTHHKLIFFGALVALSTQIVDGVRDYLLQVSYEHGCHWLYERWWSSRVIESIFRVDACKRWYAIKQGEAMGVVGTARATAYEDAFASLAWIGSGTRLAVLHQLEILARDTTWFVHSVMLKAQKNDQPLIQVQLQVLELVRERLLLAGYVFPHDGKETDLHLRLLLPNLVMQAAASRNEEVDFTLQIRHMVMGRLDKSQSVQEVLTPVLQRPPTCSLAVFATIFCAVLRRLSSPYRLTCEPTEDPRSVELMVQSGSLLTFDLVKGGMKVASTSPLAEMPARRSPLSPCAMLHRIINQIDEATKPEAPDQPGYQITMSAICAVQIVRSLVTQSFPQREAAVRTSLAATKLAPTLAYWFPLDVVTILGGLIVPLLEKGGSEHARRVVDDVIYEVQFEDQDTAPKRREGLELGFTVGDIVSPASGQEWAGIIIGWDVKWNETTAKYTLEGVTGSAHKDTTDGPFYLIVSPDHPIAYHASHYLSESQLMYAAKDSMEENLSKLFHVPMFSRYFGAVEETADGMMHITPSNELLGRYPDDFEHPNEEGEEAEDESDGDGDSDDDDDRERQEDEAVRGKSAETTLQPVWQKFSDVLRVE